jgi:hypothetical protein
VEMMGKGGLRVQGTVSVQLMTERIEGPGDYFSMACDSLCEPITTHSPTMSCDC